MSRRLILYLILFLCIGVTSRELPEYMALQDEVSNDGDVPVYNLPFRLMVYSPPEPADALGSSTSGTGSLSRAVPSVLANHSAVPVGHAGTELLHLIDQQRC